MRFGVVGGGIVGLAVARQLLHTRPGAEVTVLEKERALATHQSGHNSGVLHAGVYYPPGSDKALLCTRGRRLMVDFCAEHEVPVRRCGKVVVARDEGERDRLTELLERSQVNGVPEPRIVDPDELAEIEPEVAGVGALHSPATGVVDFGLVADRLARIVTAAGGEVRTGAAVRSVMPRGDAVRVLVGDESARFDAVVVCAGLQTDRIARAAGLGRDPAIVPFRGSYARLSPIHADRVRALVYPVPDPRYPFLGVHLTRTIDDDVLVGPNAVLALAREGYGRWDVDVRDVLDMLRWRGTWRLAGQHWRTGVREVLHSLSRRLQARQISSYLPGVTAADLAPAWSGVRAQAVAHDGELVGDFVVDRVAQVIVVRNAPSPAATSSLALAERIVGRLLDEQVQAPGAG